MKRRKRRRRWDRKSRLQMSKCVHGRWGLTDGALKTDWPDLPPKWFPLKAESCTWSLDHANNINITRRGFALVLDFSTTIHSATGRDLTSSIVDLDDFAAKPNPSATMKAYVALPRLVSDLKATMIDRRHGVSPKNIQARMARMADSSINTS